MDRATRRMHERRSCIITLARISATKAVKLALRARGLRPQQYRPSEITALAQDYFNQHRADLLAQAADLIERSPQFAQWRCANVSSDAQPTRA